MNLKSIASTCCPPFLRSVFNRIERSPIGYRLAKGTFWSAAGAITSRGLNLLAMIIVARLLGKSVFGELGMVRSTVGMFGLLAGFALGLTATKHVAEFREKDPKRAGRIIGLSWVVTAITSGAMAIVLLVCGPWLARHTIDAPHLAPMLLIGAAIVFLNALNGAQMGALSGFEAFRTIAKINFYVGVASFPILAVGAWMAGLTGAVCALAVNLGIHWLLNHLALRKEARRFGIPLRIRGCSRELPILWSFSMPVVISGIVIAPVMWGCKSIIANQPGGYAALGSFAVAESWRLIPLFFCTMIARVNLPIMAQLYSEGKMGPFRKMLLAQFYLVGVIATAGALVVLIFSKPIMASYGPDFKSDFLVLNLLILSTVPMQLTTVVGTVNRCIGRIWWNVLFNGVWGCTYLLATYILVGLGALGLALAILIAYSLQFLVAMACFLLFVSNSLKDNTQKSTI